MQIDDVIEALGYKENPNFVSGDALTSAVDYAHVYRRGVERVNLHGVYTLRQHFADKSKTESLIPTVYVCSANDESEARAFQKLVWNQNVAPFVLIHTPTRIRLFSGFADAGRKAQTAKRKSTSSPLDLAVEFNQIATVLAAFEAKSIDDGTLWEQFGRYVDPQQRVDWDLLKNLKELDGELIATGLDRKVSHALIGKYVYLSYLRQRDILSDFRLAEAGVGHDQIFSRNATRAALVKLLGYLDNWLNGSVYPLEWTRETAPEQQHVRTVAATFAGDSLDGQLHLPFDRYDFSVIPVETLSAIYEQFLHAHEAKRKNSRGKELGAYYTPVPLVNFMLDELNRRVPLDDDTTCFDASCGSGAFLVQCYRRMIEHRVRADGQPYRRPKELREILVGRVFGVDRDGDACQVTELSLILMLLDYVDPPDLAPVHNFKLPDLHNKNIFETNFFKRESEFVDLAQERRFHWVVGNPPWVELKGKIPSEDDRDAWEWINDRENRKKRPIGGNQLAEAFLWKVTDHLSDKGGAAMLVPAMTLFKDESTEFRRRFFSDIDVWTVANFANMAYVLFAGRSQVPAAAFFYSVPSQSRDRNREDDSIVAYSPLVANQDANRPDSTRRKKDTWSITIADSEIREISVDAARTGDRTPWKLAMWGSNLDHRLLQRLARHFDPLGDVCDRVGIHIHQGMELRLSDGSAIEGSSTGKRKKEPVEQKPELEGKLQLGAVGVRNGVRVYAFSPGATTPIPKEHAYVRKGRVKIPMLVSKPPHIIVDKTRRFAVFSEQFIVVPPQQIGIGGDDVNPDLLKALSLFLSSDFVTYHQFLASPSWGINVSRAVLETLITLPFPVTRVEQGGLVEWAKLHSALVAASAGAQQEINHSAGPLFQQANPLNNVRDLELELNDRVATALGLREQERWLVADLVHVRMGLIKGKVDPFATHEPISKEMVDYGTVLKKELDAFVAVVTDERHTVDIVHDGRGAMIVVNRGMPMSPKDSVRVHRADDDTARPLMAIRERLLKKHSQWVYFERSLRIYKPDATYLFKPMQYFHWLKSQALIDAGEVIADRAGTGEG